MLGQKVEKCLAHFENNNYIDKIVTVFITRMWKGTDKMYKTSVKVMNSYPTFMEFPHFTYDVITIFHHPVSHFFLGFHSDQVCFFFKP